MKIALIGYGKMGKAIEQIAKARGHEICLIIGSTNQDDLTSEKLQTADAAIEFTRPESAVANYNVCFKAGVPVISGTTGWLNHWGEVVQEMNNQNGTFFYASNFSLGVNLFFALNKKLVQLMSTRPEYDVYMEEVHHTQKLDAPSGTAISLAEDIIAGHPQKTKWTMETPSSPAEMHIEAIREGQVPGIHRIIYESEVDHIKIEHSAKSRQGFAMGAVLAAEFSQGREGVLTMSQLLKLDE